MNAVKTMGRGLTLALICFIVIRMSWELFFTMWLGVLAVYGFCRNEEESQKNNRE